MEGGSEAVPTSVQNHSCAHTIPDTLCTQCAQLHTVSTRLNTQELTRVQTVAKAGLVQEASTKHQGLAEPGATLAGCFLHLRAMG